MHNLADAVDIGVGFSVDEAGVAVAGVAADALRFDRIGRVALESERNRTGMVAELSDAAVDLLHPGFIWKRGEGIGPGVEGLCGVGTGEVVVEVAVSGEEFFGTGVERLEVDVGEWPRGRDAPFVMDNAEVFSAEAEESGAVDLGLATDVVGLLRMKRLIVFVEPHVGGVIAIVEKDCASVPVEFFLRQERAALED